MSVERVEIYEDEAGEFRWRRKAANNEITATSGEGYVHHAEALIAAERENPNLPIQEAANEDS